MYIYIVSNEYRGRTRYFFYTDEAAAVNNSRFVAGITGNSAPVEKCAVPAHINFYP